MKTNLLSTKFHIPPKRSIEILRPHLLERLNAGFWNHNKLTLISAPVGYGKTTLAAEWAHSMVDQVLCAWLSLEDADNDPERFLQYFSSAFSCVDESIYGNINRLVIQKQSSITNEWLDGLVNVLSESPKRMIMFLDDYHVISNLEIHQVVEYFLAHQPDNVHLLVTTRQDPPFPLARLRARGQMTEIRARDLRFSSDEAQKFFAQSMNIQLQPDDVETLEERTEGWIVGLQLAGLAIRNQVDPQRFIETFRGSHRYVLDFLAEEVIRQLPENTREFLCQTSVLRRFNHEICDYLTNRSDSDKVIAELEKANLFIVPLDDEREWFRYHQLFTDYLRTILSRSDQVALRKKASIWHEQNDQMFEAVDYAISSGDQEFATEVIGRAVRLESTWSAGNMNMLTRWLDSLPQSMLLNRPQLSLDAAHAFYLAGRFVEAEKCIRLAEEAIKQFSETPALHQLQAQADLYRGTLASVQGETDKAIGLITNALSRLSVEDHVAQARAMFNLGLAYEVSDEIDQAAGCYIRSAEEAKQADIKYFASHALCAAAQVQIAQGKLSAAEGSCEDAVQLLKGERNPSLGLAYSILGGIALERNQLDRCGKLLEEGINLSREGGLLDDEILGLSYLSRLRVAKMSVTEAIKVVQEIQHLVEPLGIPRMDLLTDAAIARIQLIAGDYSAASEWADRYRSTRHSATHEIAELTLARFLLAKEDYELIQTILNPLLEKAQKSGRMQSALEILMLLSLYYRAIGEDEKSSQFLKRSLDLARPEGYIRMYLDEGNPMIALLSNTPDLPVELKKELSKGYGSESKKPEIDTDPLIEPLSEQEIRVLRFIVAGMTNQEIAAELYISVGTTKWHVHNILQKMGVNNRAQAIARSRELHLL